MEVTHTDLTEVTGVELVNVGAVVVLTTGHTATTGRLAVLADTTVTGGHMAAAVKEKRLVNMLAKDCDGRVIRFFRSRSARKDFRFRRAQERTATHCFRVFEKRVGILSAVYRQDLRCLALKGDSRSVYGC